MLCVKISRRFLERFVCLDGISDDDLMHRITVSIAEVEEKTTTVPHIEKVVVGEITAIEPIEGADAIRLTHTRVEEGAEPLGIVCGAKNIAVGQRVPVALIGCVLPSGMSISQRKLKGVQSNGMLCSKEELGLEAKEDGIWLLPENAPLGAPLSEALSSDTIFTIDNHSITHRPDLFSVLGFARELSALEDTDLTCPKPPALTACGSFSVGDITANTAARFTATHLTGVGICSSPAWQQELLEASGMRPINNVVDATNLVMLELGQPVHAFNAEKVKEGLAVTTATEGETLVTLDGTPRTLTKEDLIIRSGSTAVALAGIMGGQDSEVTENTTAIVLEAATFAPAPIRRTSMRLGLRTEASTRLEKGLDPTLPPLAAARFVELLSETCPEVSVESFVAKGSPREEKAFSLALSDIETVLGVCVPTERITQVLSRLGFSPKVEQGVLTVAVPSYRAGKDVCIAQDIVEEIGRTLGYDTLESTLPAAPLSVPTAAPALTLTRTLQEGLHAAGFSEVCTIPLVSACHAQLAGSLPEEAAHLINPPSEDFKYLRSHMLMSLLPAAQKNAMHTASFALGEVATTFQPKEGATPTELLVAAGLQVGCQQDAALATIKKAIPTVLAALLDTAAIRFAPAEPSPFVHPGRAADICLGSTLIGKVAQLHPQYATQFDLPKDTSFFVIYADVLHTLPERETRYRAVSAFPISKRDVSFVVPEKLLSSKLATALSAVDPRIHTQLFDDYTNEKGIRSLAFTLSFSDTTKTLTDEEIDTLMQECIRAAEAMKAEIKS